MRGSKHPEKIEQAKAMRAAGMSLREIASALGVSETAVSYWVNPVQAHKHALRVKKAEQARRDRLPLHLRRRQCPSAAARRAGLGA